MTNKKSNMSQIIEDAGGVPNLGSDSAKEVVTPADRFDVDAVKKQIGDMKGVKFKFDKVFAQKSNISVVKAPIQITMNNKERIDILQDCLVEKLSKTEVLDFIINDFFSKYGSEIKEAYKLRKTDLDNLM